MPTICACKLIFSNKTYSTKYILLVFLSYTLYLICRYPGDPDDKLYVEGDPESPPRYVDTCLEVDNPWVTFSGTVSAIPAPAGENRVFSVEISAYAGKEAGKNAFAKFVLQCVLAGSVRWGNAFLPWVGRWITVQGDVVGTYAGATCVIVRQFSNSPKDEPILPTPGTDPVTTPR